MSSRLQWRSAFAWQEAVDTHAHLLAGGHLDPLDVAVPGVPHGPDDDMLGVFARSDGVIMGYARHYATPVAYAVGGPPIAIGSPQFITGVLLGSVVRRLRARRQAERAAEAQWRTTPLLCTAVTTRRLWCQVMEIDGPCWMRFDYSTISDLKLTGHALTMAFAASEPLCLSGEWAPWCAAVISHQRYGQDAVSILPTLQPA